MQSWSTDHGSAGRAFCSACSLFFLIEVELRLIRTTHRNVLPREHPKSCLCPHPLPSFLCRRPAGFLFLLGLLLYLAVLHLPGISVLPVNLLNVDVPRSPSLVSFSLGWLFSQHPLPNLC